MLLVSDNGSGVVSVNWMVLPVFLAQNLSLVRAIDMELNAKYASSTLTPETLVAIDEDIRGIIVEQYGIEGLDKYLDGLAHLQMQGEGESAWQPQKD